jgi:hypothetical protein
MEMIQRALEVAGRHAVAGGWLLAQLMVLACVTWDVQSNGHAGCWRAMPVLLAVAFAQLPVSLMLGQALRVFPAAVPTGNWADGIVWHVWSFVIGAFANAALWMYVGPRVARHIEARWPFERTYFGRSRTPRDG